MAYSRDEVNSMKADAVTYKARKSTKYIVIHCADTPPKLDVGAAEIRHWHLQNGWSDIGYHFVIRRTGALENGRPVDAVGSHVRGYNSTSVGVCLVGGRQSKGDKPENNFTNQQWHQLFWIVSSLVERYPDAKVIGLPKLRCQSLVADESLAVYFSNQECSPICLNPQHEARHADRLCGHSVANCDAYVCAVGRQ
jgi:N-acetylmuramoyl-L-alanine amidase